MILSAMFAATVLLADTTPAAAAAASTVSPATVTAAPKADEAKKPRLVCRTEAVTGSMFPKKTCYSVEDAAQRKQDERANLERMQNTVGLQSH